MLNKFMLIGRTTSDVDLTLGDDRKSRGVVSIAVNETWTQNGEKQEKTEYFRLTFWGAQAENAAKYVGKGSEIFVEGRIENTVFQKEGKDVYGTNYNVTEISYLNTKKPASS